MSSTKQLTITRPIICPKCDSKNVIKIYKNLNNCIECGFAIWKTLPKRIEIIEEEDCSCWAEVYYGDGYYGKTDHQ